VVAPLTWRGARPACGGDGGSSSSSTVPRSTFHMHLDLRLGPKDGSMQYEVHKSVRVKSSEYMRSRGLTYS
jgi:hypothetical protein